MKGNKKILVVALLLLLVAVSFGTYAIYKTSLSGTATINAAHWSAVLKKSVDSTQTTLTDSFTLTMADFECEGGHGKNNTVAPGDYCVATLVADLDGSEVDALVTVSLTTTGISNRFTISLLDENDDPVAGAVSVPYSATAGDMEETFKVKIEWDGTDGETQNTADVTLQGQAVQIPVTITAAQDMTVTP